MSEQEFKILQKSISTLKFHGLWPKLGEYSKPGIRFYRNFILSIILPFPLWSGALLHLIVIIKKNIGLDVSEEIATIASLVGLLYISTFFVINQKSLNYFYRHLSNFSKFGKPHNFDEENQRLNFYSTMFSFYCIFGTILYAFIALVTIPKCLQLNKEQNLAENCCVFIPSWFPFKIDYFPVREIHFLTQFIGAFMTVRGGATVSFTNFESARYIALKINHLKRLLTQVFDEEDYQTRRRRLNFCIRYHIDIIEIFNNFNSCYKNSMGVHLVITGAIFGCLGYNVIQSANPVAAIHLLGWIFSLYIVCNGGQILIIESMSIGEAAYNSKWNKAELDLQKDLVMLILRAQRPFFVQAGSFGTLSFPIFVAILKTSYSYITLLNQTI